MKKKLIVLLILVLIALPLILYLRSCTFNKDKFRYKDYIYKIENDEVTIVEYNGTDENVIIPNKIKGAPVVTIGRDAFERCDSIKSLTIPDSVVKIDSSAFFECSSLEQVTLGNGIREIDILAFSNCRKLNYKKFGNGSYLGNDENPYMALLSVSADFITSINIHPDTRIICGSAFKECSSLREVVLPEGVISIGTFAFNYCSSLESVYIPKSVEIIGRNIFGDCNSLLEIVVSDENQHFKSVNGSLFSRDGTRLIKYPPAQDLSSYRVPDGTVIIEENAFENAKKLTEVVLADSVEEIYHSAFSNCENMTSIYLGNSLKTIEGCAFNCCKSLTEITIPDSVLELSYNAFQYCDKLESVVIGSGVVRLEEKVFLRCDALKEVVFRNPGEWKVNTMSGLNPNTVDTSDPEQNAYYLKDKYHVYYWRKK